MFLAISSDNIGHDFGRLRNNMYYHSVKLMSQIGKNNTQSFFNSLCSTSEN